VFPTGHLCADGCGKIATFVDGEPGKRWIKAHAPYGSVHVTRPCAAGAGCGKYGS
jgi:hypothetical protein